MQIEETINFQEVTKRLIKYLIEGFGVGLAAMLIPNANITWQEAVYLAVVAAAILSILDTVSPSISTSVRSGVGFSIGAKTMGWTPGAF